MLVLPSSDISGLASGEELLQACLDDQGLLQATKHFLLGNEVIPPTRRSLYVAQGEQGTAAWNHHEDLVIGSQSATTCVILVARCPITRLAYAVHHDDGTSQLPVSQLLAFLSQLRQPEIYLVGGYSEPSGVSHQICCTLLAALHTRTPHTKLHVKLACLYTHNTHPATGAPLAHSLMVDCSTGLAYPGLLADRGPEMDRRFAFNACCAWNGVDYGLATVAHAAYPGLMVLPAVPVLLATPYATYLQRKLQLPEQALLQSSSTSPAHEPWYFTRDLKAGYKWMLSQQTTGLRQLPPVCYRWVGSDAASSGDECSADGQGWRAESGPVPAELVQAPLARDSSDEEADEWAGA